MQIEKKVVTNLTKCYSLAELSEQLYLVASEKQFPCLVISRDGEVLDKVWDGPGGVMTMEPLTDSNTLYPCILLILDKISVAVYPSGCPT